MSSSIWDDIEAALDPGSPSSPALVVRALRRQPAAAYAPGTTVLDPCCHDGQFLAAVKWVKVLVHGMSEQDAERDLYGTDTDPVMVARARRRLPHATILVGDPARPGEALPGQGEGDRQRMLTLFG